MTEIKPAFFCKNCHKQIFQKDDRWLHLSDESIYCYYDRAEPVQPVCPVFLEFGIIVDEIFEPKMSTNCSLPLNHKGNHLVYNPIPHTRITHILIKGDNHE